MNAPITHAYAYTISPARYAKNQIAIHCPSADQWKSRACLILESVAPVGKSGRPSLRYSNRERSYIVSRRVAAKFEDAIALARLADEEQAEQARKEQFEAEAEAEAEAECMQAVYI